MDKIISKYSGSDDLIKRPLGGGSINDVFKVSSGDKDYCVKVNSKSRYPGMFEAERKGLEILASTDSFTIPKVLGVEEDGDTAFLILEYIESEASDPQFNERFAMNLEKLHKHHHNSFGLDHNNYIGSLDQPNEQMNSWKEFYSDQRIMYQAKEAFDDHYLDEIDIKALENFCSRINELFPVEPASLLHGDLWSGNYMVGKRGEPCLIDPAVYYGHREMDLGMMKLFGGFSREIFDLYNERYPMEGDWQSRIPYTQLYPLLVHVNLFGGGYVGQVKRIIDKFRP